MPEMRELVNPSEAYLNSYIAACRETWGHTFSDYILHDPARVDAWRGSIVLNTENAVKILDRLHAHGVCPYRTRARRLCCIDGRPRELVQFTY